MRTHHPGGASHSPRAYMLLSIAAAIVTITLKTTAFLLTQSVGLFSDAAESVINLIAAVAGFWALTIAARPPDEEHEFGHTKAEYFSSGLEGFLILLAALAIAAAALPRLWQPRPLDNAAIGLAVSLVGTAINGGVAFVLMRAGKRLRSITLRADAIHLLTDVWTSAGVLAGVVLVLATGWLALDPIVALLVAANIAWSAFKLIRDAGHGLLDTGLSAEDKELIEEVLSRHRAEGLEFHALRTRVSGQRRFISMHVLLPGSWTIERGHEMCERIEGEIRQNLPVSTIFTHMEPIENPVSHEDQGLDRQPIESC